MADGGGEPGAGGGSAPVCNFVRKPPKNIRKRPAATAGSDDEDDGGAIAALRSKKGSSATGKLIFSTDASSEPRRFQYESSRTIQASTDSLATATLETETEFDRDARAIRERQLKQAEEALKKNPSSASAAGSGSREVYKGIHGYTDYKAGFRWEHTVSSEKAGGFHGPLRASAHIWLSAQFDY